MPTGVVPLAPTSIPKLPQIQDMVKWTGDWRHDNIANPNVNREDVNREKCAKDVAFQVEKQFKTFKAKNPRINELRSPGVQRDWRQFAAVFQSFIGRYHPTTRFPRPKVYKIKHKGETLTSIACAFETISQQVVILPDYSKKCLEELTYREIISYLFNLNDAFWAEFGEKFTMEREGIYWIFFAIVEIDYSHEPAFKRRAKLREATGWQADKLWKWIAERGEEDEEHQFIDSYIHPDESLQKLKYLDCPAALILPNSTHLLSPIEQKADYMRYVPETLVENYLRANLGRELVNSAWEAFVALRIMRHKLEHSRHYLRTAPTLTDAETLWTAIEKAREYAKAVGLRPAVKDKTRAPFCYSFEMVEKFGMYLWLPLAQPYECNEPPFLSFTRQVQLSNSRVYLSIHQIKMLWGWIGRKNLTAKRIAESMSSEAMFADYWRNNCLEPVHICICMPPVIQSQEQSNDSTIEDVTDTELSYEDRITDYSDDVSREDTLDTELSYRDGVTERSEVESDKTPDETEPNETEKRCVDKSDEDDQPPKKRLRLTRHPNFNQ